MVVTNLPEFPATTYDVSECGQGGGIDAKSIDTAKTYCALSSKGTPIRTVSLHS